MRNVEAESIKSRDESTGGGVNLKTVTEITQRCARNSFFVVVNNVYLVPTELCVRLGASGEIETKE